MQIIKKVALLLAAASIVGPALPAEPPVSGSARPDVMAELFGDPVIAKGKGLEIKQSQLDREFILYRANLTARGQDLSESQRTVREAQLLDRLLVTRLVNAQATAADQAKAREVAAKFIEQAKKAVTSEEAFGRQLKALGLGLDGFAARVAEQALSEVIIERELKAGIEVTDAQIQEFYDTGADNLVKAMQTELERLAKTPETSASQLAAAKEQTDRLRKANLAKLNQPEKVRISHIYFATRNRQTEAELPEDQKQAKRQLLEKVLLKARTGEDFAKLVEKYSEDQGLKETHGEYTLTREDSFTPEFKAAAFSLTNGQISEIVTTAFGYHIVKLLERIPAQKLALDKVKTDLKDHLTQQALQQKMPAYFARLKKEAGVEVLEPKYRLSTPGEPTPSPKPPG